MYVHMQTWKTSQAYYNKIKDTFGSHVTQSFVYLRSSCTCYVMGIRN